MAIKSADVIEATVTSKGQITVPGEIRRDLGVVAGDKIQFVRARDGSISIHGRKRRSIIDIARERPIKFAEKVGDMDVLINEAIDLAMADKDRRSRSKARK